ncbi:MAG: hypothetical protein JWQ71_3863 [Pedosphaera sp.]|nr:hypothetical protein [Pedosphaera sp.]
MAKKMRLAKSRKAEVHKIDMAVKMEMRGESSPHGRRTNPRAVMHRELEAPFIPIIPKPRLGPRKLRRGRHHKPPSGVRSSGSAARKK